MEDNKKNLNKTGGTSWVSAIRIFSEVSTWIVVPIILAVILGKHFDARYGTGHWMLLSFAGVSFLISSYGIVRAVKKYSIQIKKDDGKL